MLYGWRAKEFFLVTQSDDGVLYYLQTIYLAKEFPST